MVQEVKQPEPKVGPACPRCGVEIVGHRRNNSRGQWICGDDSACATRHLANVIWLVTGATVRQMGAETLKEDTSAIHLT